MESWFCVRGRYQDVKFTRDYPENIGDSMVGYKRKPPGYFRPALQLDTSKVHVPMLHKELVHPGQNLFPVSTGACGCQTGSPKAMKSGAALTHPSVTSLEYDTPGPPGHQAPHFARLIQRLRMQNGEAAKTGLR